MQRSAALCVGTKAPGIQSIPYQLPGTISGTRLAPRRIGVPQKTAAGVSHLHEVGDEGDRLDGLAQAHLVREDAVEVVVVQRNLSTKGHGMGPP